MAVLVTELYLHEQMNLPQWVLYQTQYHRTLAAYKCYKDELVLVLVLVLWASAFELSGLPAAIASLCARIVAQQSSSFFRQYLLR